MRLVCAGAIFLMLFGISCKPPESKVSISETDMRLATPNQKPAEWKGWQLSIDTDRMDNTPTVYLSKLAENGQGGMLAIRCIRRKTELVVATDDVLDNGSVRIKFDDAKPDQQVWSESSNHQGLFASDPIGLARRLTKTDSFLFEYKPFQKQPKTVEFKVNGLADKLGPLEEACGWAKIDQAKARAQAAVKADAELPRKRDALVRQVLSKHVEACREKWLQDKNRWCWYDDSNASFKGGAPFESREAALDDAVHMAKFGQFFTAEMAQIKSKLGDQ